MFRVMFRVRSNSTFGAISHGEYLAIVGEEEVVEVTGRDSLDYLCL